MFYTGKLFIHVQDDGVLDRHTCYLTMHHTLQFSLKACADGHMDDVYG